MERPPKLETKISAKDITIFNNFTDGENPREVLQLEMGDFESDVMSFDIHHLVKEGRTEDLYSLTANLTSQKKHVINELASCLDYDGMAALHYAAENSSIVAAKILLDNKVNIDVQSKFGETPLHLAIRHGNIPLVYTFMDRGASLSKTDKNGNNSLHFATEKGLKGVAIKILMNAPLLVCSKNNTGYTALHFAAMYGDANLCEKLLLNEANITIANINGETPLHLASLMNHLDVIKKLLENGCTDEEDRIRYLTIQRKDSLTALHIAAKMGHVKTVRYILDMGVKIESDKSANALQLAAGNGHIELMQLLLQNGANTESRDRYGNTPLHVAATTGQVKAMEILINTGAEMEATNEERWTPLFCAVSKSQYEAAELLLRNGADSARIDGRLRSCLHYAVKEGCCRIILLLLEHGGDRLLFQRDNENRLALHEAVLSGNERILEMLLRKCSGTVVYFEDNKTIIHVAAENGKIFCLKMLINIWPRDYINMVDSNGRSALHLAAMNGHRHSVRLLIEGKADVYCIDKDGLTAYHLAILNHHNDVLQEFIKANTEMVPEDGNYAISSDNVDAVKLIMDYISYNYAGRKDFKYEGFSEVLDGDHEEVAEAMVEHDSFEIGVRHNNINLEEIMPTMIRKYPDVALKILDKGITFSQHRSDSPDFQVVYDFAALETSPDFSLQLFGSELYFGPALMAFFDRADCLQHPLTQKMMAIKWNLHGAFVYYLSLLLYLTFTISLTTLVILHRNVKLQHVTTTKSFNTTQSNCTSCSKQSNDQNISLPKYLTDLAILIFIFNCFQMVKEFGQFLVTRRRYFREITNLYEWIIIISTLAYLNGSVLFRNYTSGRIELLFAVFCLFFIWLNVLFFLRRSPFFNIYVVMFSEVIITLIRVLCVFTPLLLAFALVFHQLFIKQSLFKDFGNSMMKVFVMFSGELEYSDTLPNSIGKTANQIPLVPLPILSYLLFVFFIVAIPIALMNLLVGLAVGDIESIRKTAKYNVLKQQALYMEDLHTKCPKFLIKWAYKRYHIEKPNQFSFWTWYTSLADDGEFAEMLQGLRLAKSRKGKEETTQDEKLDAIQKTLEDQSMRMSAFRRKMETDMRRMNAMQ